MSKFFVVCKFSSSSWYLVACDKCHRLGVVRMVLGACVNSGGVQSRGLVSYHAKRETVSILVGRSHMDTIVSFAQRVMK